MADYSTSLRTQYLEARVHVNNRMSEFRLDKNTLYQSNLRLINVGAVPNTDGGYNRQAGVLSVIKNIRLMDGSRELSSLRHAGSWLPFRNIQATNEQIQNKHDRLHRSRASFQYTDDGTVDESLESANTCQATNASDLHLGYIDLRMCLPLLNNIPALDTAVFPNLRLVVEYETRSSMVTLHNDKALTISRPTLIADEVVGDQKAQSLRAASQGSIVWNEIEHDVFQVPKGTNPTTDGGETEQSVSAVINGFDNKYVSRVLIVKDFVDKTENFSGTGAIGNGNQVSLAMYKESIQVRHQGANLFSGDGLRNNAFKDMLLSETWGQVNIPPFGSRTQVGLDNENLPFSNISGVLEPKAPTATTTNNRAGQYAYIGFHLEDKVKQLNFTYKRSCGRDEEAASRGQTQVNMNVNIYGEVRKVLTMGKGGYDVSYA